MYFTFGYKNSRVQKRVPMPLRVLIERFFEVPTISLVVKMVKMVKPTNEASTYRH